MSLWRDCLPLTDSYRIYTFKEDMTFSTEIPDYVYDIHTPEGKARNKTAVDFIIDEQKALNPHVHGEFDTCSWDRYLELRMKGFYDKDHFTPSPSKKTMEDFRNGIICLDFL